MDLVDQESEGHQGPIEGVGKKNDQEFHGGLGSQADDESVVKFEGLAKETQVKKEDVDAVVLVEDSAHEGAKVEGLAEETQVKKEDVDAVVLVEDSAHEGAKVEGLAEETQVKKKMSMQ